MTHNLLNVGFIGVVGSSASPAVGSGGNSTGTFSLDGETWKYHMFTGNGTFTVTTGGLATVLMVGGGGNGGTTQSGGGGGGGVLYMPDANISAGSYAVVIGNGGGGNTTFLGETAKGGEPREIPEQVMQLQALILILVCLQ